MEFYPFKFQPIYKERIWGGQKLREFFGKDLPADTKIGESWELADLPEDKSVIANGQFHGQTLESVIQRNPAEITGRKNFSGAFPLLIKLLDAQDVLSVQVHPDVETCLRMGKGDAKTECWYIIDAEPGAVIYKGLKDGVTKEQFSKAINQGNVEDLLKKIEVHQDECHFLPAGTVHAIGKGLLIAEIQTPSDTTYRVFDWNRVDENGKGRQLHIEEATKSIHFDSSGDNLTVATDGQLVNCEFFKIDKINLTKNEQKTFSANQMQCLMIINGSGAITGDDGFCVEFKAGDTLLVPAVFKGKLEFTDKGQYLKITI